MYELYDKVELKDGRKGDIVDARNGEVSFIDIELMQGKFETVSVCKDEILRKITKVDRCVQ